MEALLLRLEAPLVAFGGTMVDQHGFIRQFPSGSMLTGLLANALGYHHGDFEKLNRLQQRIRFAARIDREGTPIVDYQTVDLGQDFLVDTGWTTRGYRQDRGGGTARTGTHIRYRHYYADRVCTVALTLDPPDEDPTLEQIEHALDEPARPLFIGRKSCLPSVPIKIKRMTCQSLVEALKKFPARKRRLPAQWPEEEGDFGEGKPAVLCDERDWENQIHCGERYVFEGNLTMEVVLE